MFSAAPVMHELMELVICLDPARREWERLGDQIQDRCQALRLEVDRLQAQLANAAREHAIRAKLSDALSSLSSTLSDLSDAVGERSAETNWQRLYRRLAQSYERLAHLSKAIPDTQALAPKLTPKNYVRNVFHVLTGVAGATAYHFLLDHQSAILVMLALAGSFTLLELTRRLSHRWNDALMRFPFFRRIARPHEYYRINSSTYYATGLLLCAWLFPRAAVEIGCLVLAFGDPAASLLGRRFGRTKLFGHKSVVGTVSFFGAALIAVLAWMSIVYPAVGLPAALLIAVTAALAGAIAEVAISVLDDNFTVPLAVCAATALLV